MKVVAYEGIVENGCIHLHAGVSLPEKAKVYVVVPDAGTEPAVIRIASPRLADPAQSPRFKLEVIEGSTDAGGP
jgi:hypothetical protein